MDTGNENLTGQPTQATLPGATPETPVANSIVAGLSTAVNSALAADAAAEPEKRGRGRPRKNPVPVEGLGQLPGIAPDLQTQKFGADGKPVPPEFPKKPFNRLAAERFVKGLVTTAINYLSRRLETDALARLGDAGLAKAHAEGWVEQDAVDDTIEGLVQCYEKYLPEIEYTAEMLAGSGVVRIAFGYTGEKREIAQAAKKNGT